MGAGRAKSPCEWLTGDTVCWLWNGLDALEEPWAGGMQRGRAAGSLAKVGVVLPPTPCVCSYFRVRNAVRALGSHHSTVQISPEVLWDFFGLHEAEVAKVSDLPALHWIVCQFLQSLVTDHDDAR